MPNLLITGGARGIGRATAVLAARRGWSVAVNFATNHAAADETLAEIESLGQKGIVLQGDVGCEHDVQIMFERAQEALGRLDALVVNAGIVGPAQRLADMDPARIRAMITTNTIGALLCAREGARRMGHSFGGRGGAMVIVSSKAAALGSPNEYVDYAASKGALDTMAIGLAKELGPDGIRVNAVRPGLIETEIHASGGQPDRAERLGAQTPLGRAGRADEVAMAILWLLGAEASYTTGAILDVAGGR